jgi:hypothetical protein
MDIVEYKNKLKAERRSAEEETNQTGGYKYNCMTCHHHKVNSCKGLSKLSKVCSYWFNPSSEIQGLAYSAKIEVLPLFEG